MAYPSGLPRKYRPHWDRPWRPRARNSPGFRRWLDAHGYLSPHFTLAEAACKDGTPVPTALNRGARNHAFNLERLRRRLGDRPIPVISWYRTPAHNRRVGGAPQSKHLSAFATDHPKQWVNQVGRSLVLRHGDAVFRNGGMGVYPAGSMHFDSRGVRARWTSF